MPRHKTHIHLGIPNSRQLRTHTIDPEAKLTVYGEFADVSARELAGWGAEPATEADVDATITWLSRLEITGAILRGSAGPRNRAELKAYAMEQIARPDYRLVYLDLDLVNRLNELRGSAPC